MKSAGSGCRSGGRVCSPRAQVCDETLSCSASEPLGAALDSRRERLAAGEAAARAASRGRTRPAPLLRTPADSDAQREPVGKALVCGGRRMDRAAPRRIPRDSSRPAAEVHSSRSHHTACMELADRSPAAADGDGVAAWPAGIQLVDHSLEPEVRPEACPLVEVSLNSRDLTARPVEDTAAAEADKKTLPEAATAIDNRAISSTHTNYKYI